MITRIELHNFMSHRETVIEPAPGLTVLVGPNNCGKSAVVAALQVLSQNRNSKLFTRHGEKLCSVVIHTSEGHIIEWRRKDSPSYRINGQVFDRLGRSGIPDELQPLLRLPTVADEDDDSFNVHFGNQKSPIFLLGSSAGVAAKFFASSSDAIRLVEMQQRHQQRVTDSRRQRKQFEAEAEIVNAELEALNATVPLADGLTELESLHALLEELQSEISDLERSSANLVERSDRVEKQAALAEALRPLADPPVLMDIQPLVQQIASIEKFRSVSERLSDESLRLKALPFPPVIASVSEPARLVEQIEFSEARVKRLDCNRRTLAPLQSPPPLADCDSLEALVRQVTRAQADIAVTSARCGRLASLTSVPEMTPTESFNALLTSIERQTCEVEQFQETATVASRLEAAPVLADESGLAGLLGTLAAADRQAAELRKSLASLAADLAATAAAMREAVRGQSCPTCGQAFDADQLLALGAGGHTHG